ncbi:hypothetical protein Bp8pS_070 [Bacillus phage vB_BpuM-BpSp]|nr:hypothetical protein Bp8pS_070 [Bacillus phage vB_BpuM-BpSp]
MEFQKFLTIDKINLEFIKNNEKYIKWEEIILLQIEQDALYYILKNYQKELNLFSYAYYGNSYDKKNIDHILSLLKDNDMKINLLSGLISKKGFTRDNIIDREFFMKYKDLFFQTKYMNSFFSGSSRIDIQFIEEIYSYMTEEYWDFLSFNPNIDREFITYFSKNLNWKFLLKNQIKSLFNEKFIEENCKNFGPKEWKYISRHFKLTKRFVVKHIKDLSMSDLKDNGLIKFDWTKEMRAKYKLEVL